MRYIIVVNARAGTVLELGQAAFATRVAEAFAAHGCTAEVKLVSPKELHSALALAIADPDAIPVVAGGDGTINGVAMDWWAPPSGASVMPDGVATSRKRAS